MRASPTNLRNRDPSQSEGPLLECCGSSLTMVFIKELVQSSSKSTDTANACRAVSGGMKSAAQLRYFSATT
jgi:hypothetical protein